MKAWHRFVVTLAIAAGLSVLLLRGQRRSSDAAIEVPLKRAEAHAFEDIARVRRRVHTFDALHESTFSPQSCTRVEVDALARLQAAILTDLASAARHLPNDGEAEARLAAATDTLRNVTDMKVNDVRRRSGHALWYPTAIGDTFFRDQGWTAADVPDSKSRT
jgi:hypothetical protein